MWKRTDVFIQLHGVWFFFLLKFTTILKTTSLKHRCFFFIFQKIYVFIQQFLLSIWFFLKGYKFRDIYRHCFYWYNRLDLLQSLDTIYEEPRTGILRHYLVYTCYVWYTLWHYAAYIYCENCITVDYNGTSKWDVDHTLGIFPLRLI